MSEAAQVTILLTAAMAVFAGLLAYVFRELCGRVVAPRAGRH